MEDDLTERGLLHRAQTRAGFDQLDRDRIAPRRAHHAERVNGERTATGAKLGIADTLGPSRARPRLGQCGADQFAVHLADFGRRGEVARRAERVAGGVIIVVAGLHIGLDAEPALGAETLPQRALERSHRSPPTALTLSLSKGQRSRFDKLNGSASSSRHALRSRRRLDPHAAARGGDHQVEAAQNHRDAQPLAHVEPRRLREIG